jgi:hypothetical protein
MPRRGRPRRTLKDKADTILREQTTRRASNRKKVALLLALQRSGKPINIEELIKNTPEELDRISRTSVRRWPRPPELAFRGACVLYTLENRTLAEALLRQIDNRIQSEIGMLKKYARVHGPQWKPWTGDREFLESLIERHAPGWDWRKQIDDGGRQRGGVSLTKKGIAEWQKRIATNDAKNATTSFLRRNKRMAEDGEQMAQAGARAVLHYQARKLRFATAPEPERQRLRRLSYVKPNDPTTWPTLRELKLATAIPERTIKEIIKRLRPKQGEIVEKPRERFSRRGAMGNCYGPRLVSGVIDEFLKRLPDYEMEDYDRKQCQKAALAVERAIEKRCGSKL